MKILITGASGLLGGRIAEYLASFSELSLYLASRNALPEKLSALGNSIILNLEDIKSVQDAVSEMDVVIHLAGMNAQDCALDSYKCMDVNSSQSQRLLKVAESASVKRFIYFSTMHVYGNSLKGEINEEFLPRPMHPYSISHRAIEDFVLCSQSKGNIEGIVLRLSNGFGAPLMPETNCWMLLGPDLCRQAIERKCITLKSNINITRDFIAISDVVKAVKHCLYLDEQLLGDGLFNVASGVSLSLLEIAKLVASRCEVLFGFSPKIECLSGDRGIPDAHTISTKKIQCTGFSFTGSISDEIDRLLEFCRKHF